MELPEVTDYNKSIMEKKQGCDVTFSPVKTRKRKRKSAFLSPDNITPISGSGYKIIDSSMLQELISASRCSFCKNGTLQVRQDNKKRKGMCETLLLYCKSCGKTLKPVTTNQVVHSNNRSEKLRLTNINLRSVIATTPTGGGLTSLRKFCTDLNPPEPVTENSYNRYLHHIENFAIENCKRSMKKAAQELRTLILNGEPDLGKSTIDTIP